MQRVWYYKRRCCLCKFINVHKLIEKPKYSEDNDNENKVKKEYIPPSQTSNSHTGPPADNENGLS